MIGRLEKLKTAGGVGVAAEDYRAFELPLRATRVIVGLTYKTPHALLEEKVLF